MFFYVLTFFICCYMGNYWGIYLLNQSKKSSFFSIKLEVLLEPIDPSMGGFMNCFSEHEMEFFKRLRKTGQKVNSEPFKFSLLIIFIFASLILIPLINVIN